MEARIATLRKHRANIITKIEHHNNMANAYTIGTSAIEITHRLCELKDLWEDHYKTMNKLEEIDENCHTLVVEDLEWIEKALAARIHIEQILEQIEPKQADNIDNTSNHHKDDIKLPAVTIPTFDGNPTAWLPFRDLFIALIHSKNGMSKVTKMHYLKSSVSGVAADALKNLQITEANYDIAWNRLEERYHNNRVLIDIYIGRLMNQPNIPSRCASAIRTLIDTTNETIQMINSLGGNTENWDPLLIHMIVRKLDSYTQQIWREKLKASKQLTPFSELMEFLEIRAQVLEETPHSEKPTYNGNNNYGNAKSNANNNNNNHKSKPKSWPQKSHAIKTASCTFCNENHQPYRCDIFSKSSLSEKMKLIHDKKACNNCLYIGHEQKSCKSKGKCKHCEQRHHSSIHDQFQATASNAASHNIHNVNVTHGKKTLLATALVPVYGPNGNCVILKTLIDQGGEVSTMSTYACQQLQLKIQKANVQLTGLNDSNLGTARGMTDIVIGSSIDPNYRYPLKVLVMPKVSESQTINSKNKRKWSHLHGLQLADPTYDQPGRIDLQLGVEIYAEILMSGVIKGTDNAPIAQQTKLGYILSGRTDNTNGSVARAHTINMNSSTVKLLKNESSHNNVQSSSLFDDNSIATNLKRFWEIENLPSKRVYTAEDEIAEQHYTKTIQQSENGRFIVSLPFNIDEKDPNLFGESRKMAMWRFMALERRFDKQPDVKTEYHKVIRQYFDMGHLIEVPYDRLHIKPSYYLPHHAVTKASSTTTQTRVVFDGSAKTSNGYSLNDRLCTGPQIQDELFNIFVRWRTYKIVFTADIEKMYRQFSMHSDHQKFQRILWRFDKNSPIKTYELTTNTFGISCAPFLAVRSLLELVKRKGQSYPLAAKILSNNTYVDDTTAGADSVEEAIDCRNQLISLLECGQLPIRKWTSNCAEFLEDIPIADREIGNLLEMTSDDTLKALGILWCPSNDTIQFKVNLDSSPSLTKRAILTEIARLYDPFGWLSAIIIKAKILLQLIHISGHDWDSPIEQQYAERWNQWKNELKQIESIRIPRWLSTMHGLSDDTYELHGFSDASEAAYAACIYIRIRHPNNTISIQLIAAKSKVAPIKKLSLPRLELLAAELLANLMTTIQSAMQIKIAKIYAWTDSSIVLAWLQQHPSKWHTFVANRVSNIQSIIEFDKWRHVPSKSNSADCASRGMLPSEFVNFNLWWAGPDFLHKSEEHWPKLKIDANSTNQEIKNAVIFLNSTEQIVANMEQAPAVVMHGTITEENPILLRHSNLHRLLITTALCMRFKSKQRGLVSVEERANAMNIWIRHAQHSAFSTEINDLKKNHKVHAKSKIISFDPYMDENGILRIGGRLENAKAYFSAKHPIILPSDGHFINLIMRDAHDQCMHGGTQLTLYTIRQTYWIMNGKRVVTQFIKRCMICARWKAKPKQQFMAPLPAERISQSHVFLHTGVDYCGPFEVLANGLRKSATTKCYVSVFVCFATKAIHLELVSDLSTVRFLAAFRRFIARRGKPQKMYSDRGRNFIGASKLLLDMFNRNSPENDCIQKELLKDGIAWDFLPGDAASMGGLWESSVAGFKRHYRRIIGNQKLNFEQMYTLVVQIEAILNSRPLCVVPTDCEDINVLTPGHFLIHRPITQLPDPPLLDIKSSRLDQWQHVQQMQQHFWKRWHDEYLHTLQQRSKWHTRQPNTIVGEIVLLLDDNLPPSDWRLGRIIEVYPDKHGIVRKMDIQTAANGQKAIYHRPISKIAALPISEAD